MNESQTPGQIAWNRFRRNPLAMAGLGFILLVFLIAFLGPLIRPDQTESSNDQNLSISRKKPGFTMEVLRVKKTDQQDTGILTMWLNGGRPKTIDEIPVTDAVVRGDTLVYHTPGSNAEKTVAVSSVQFEGGSLTSTKRFLLGTDKYGRDLLSRLMAGSVISLSVGAIAVFISLLIGLTLGLIAGYYRGRADQIIMWFTNVVWAIPTLILVMAITFAFGTGFWKIFLAVGLTMWVEVARIARGQVLSVREKEYIEAARALGLPEWRIIVKHILPNILSPIIVISAANFASAILIEAGLSFLGLGAQIPTPSWGNMIREHYAYITTDLAYLAIVPGVMIMLLVLAFMLVGNGLRDALDVRE